METKPFPEHPFLGKILVVAITGSVGMLLGVLAILFVRPNGLLLGVALLLASSAVEIFMLFRAIGNAPCPTCGRLLKRQRSSGAFACEPCATLWTLPRTTR
jgi:ABC-type uncharacterized transport system permease subunit